ncbi:hypothetical protein COHA_006625 [Chlorella ohadii]|uniref:Uncharacterized protein n=1 Tax=Chlorella ohadii TaxID=2649997 RepID=A0AAD5DPM1_9CHLO|nr:hypothetical protein COHA_006625 [Chlorella ohadii]
MITIMARGRFRNACSGAALAALTILAFIAPFAYAARQGAAETAPRWERARGLPPLQEPGLPLSFVLEDPHRTFGEYTGPEETFPNLAIDGASGVGLLSASVFDYNDYTGSMALYCTLDSGRNWAKISSHYISGIWMAGSHAAFAVGQLAPEYNSTEPTALLKWTRGKGWAVSLKLPKASKAAGIEVQQVAVTDGGRNAFVLGLLLWRKGEYLISEGPDGQYTQRVWRYSAATDTWAVVREDKTPDTGDIAYYSGKTWRLARKPAEREFVSRMHADGPGRAFIELKYYGVEFGQGFMEVWHFNGTAWVRKLEVPFYTPYEEDEPCIGSSAVAPGFALFASQGNCNSPQAQLWRWDGSLRPLTHDFDFTTQKPLSISLMDHHHIVRAASSKAAVFANWVDSGPSGACRLESKRWRGAGWKDVRPIQGLPDCDVHALVPAAGRRRCDWVQEQRCLPPGVSSPLGHQAHQCIHLPMPL